MDAVLLQFKTPSKAALFGDLKALLGAAGMGGFLPDRAGQMVNPWLRAGYRLDWKFFRLTRTLQAARIDERGEEITPAETIDRGLHCDVLLTRTDPAKAPVGRKLRQLRERVRALPEADHDSPQSMLDRFGTARARVHRAGRGSVVLSRVAVPHHVFQGHSGG
jgi:hypothetical protein